MKTIAIVQARMGSTRLPGKVMHPIRGVPMIELLLTRLSRACQVDEIVLATSTNPDNRSLINHVRDLGYPVFQGSEEDVLDRYYRAARHYRADIVVRITGDCPLIDPGLVDHILCTFHQSHTDYMSNTCPPTYPDGLDTEVFTFEALEKASKEAISPFDREHVTPYMKVSERFEISCVRHAQDCSQERWTVDEPEDMTVIKNVFQHFHPRLDFTWPDTLDLCRQKPELFKANRHHIRDQGSCLGRGQKLWNRAKRVIPGGNMLLSKRAEMFLPGQWPSYFTRARGCRIQDLDGREYIDIGFMGIGTNILGYGHPEVDEAVRAIVDKGNMSTLNCPEEVYLAEKLIQLHPWADMVRLARTGGEANAIAIRIARAASGRSRVAFCGYHGWHDWYLAANLENDSGLSEHLLPGLAPNGVPPTLQGTVHPFGYNRFHELKALVETHDIGVIKMEVARNQEPRDNFLEKVRQLATDKGIILIFDECTSGFRQSFGGLHKAYGVEPDMAVFGKALGNGYAITAVIGRRAIMEAAQTTFISSTFWTERIGPTAALKTLDIMEKTRSWERITRTGGQVTREWQALAEKHGLNINIFGLDAMKTFAFDSPHALAYKTLITQEMLEKGYLATTAFYACTCHTPEIIAAYIKDLDPVFGLIRDCEDGRDIASLLKGPPCHDGFRRLA